MKVKYYDLENKRVFITGGGSGIGASIVEHFCEQGSEVYFIDINEDESKKLIEDIKNKNYSLPTFIKCDLLNIKELQKTIADIISNKGPIDILINNAAIIHTAIFQMTSIKKLKEVFETNFFGQSNFTQYILKSMVKNKKGSIINISSSSALDGNEGRSAYSASKNALIAQTKVLSRELGSNNIRVNVIAPGLTNTDMMKKNTPQKVVDDVLSKVSLKRVADPEEIANVALLISSDLSSYITGQVIRVDGGM